MGSGRLTPAATQPKPSDERRGSGSAGAVAQAAADEAGGFGVAGVRTFQCLHKFDCTARGLVAVINPQGGVSLWGLATNNLVYTLVRLESRDHDPAADVRSSPTGISSLTISTGNFTW